jgi:hypothetical protein
MYETGWLSLVGLSFEVGGLALLSYDLLKTKISDGEGDSFRSLQDQLEASTRQHIFLLTQHVDLVSNFFAKTQVVVARRPEYEEILQRNPNLAEDDPDKYALIRDALDTSPAGFQRRSAETFLRELEKLESAQKIEAALALNAQTSRVITERLGAAQKLAARLGRVAKIGITLAAIGAVAQFLDIFV